MRSLPMGPRDIVAVFLLSLALVSAVARAENANPAKVQALATLQEGNALLGQGRAAEALMKFTEAYRLFPSPKLHYNIGQAHSLIPGHEAQAYESMSRFLTEAVDANPELRAAAETQRQQLRPKVGLLSVSADPPDADLIVDDVNVGRAQVAVPTVVGIGPHILALKREDAASSPRTITIVGGEMLNLSLSLASVVAPPGFPPPQLLRPPPPPPITGGYWTWQHKLGAGLGGLAVASLAVGVIEHVRYFGKKDDFVNKGCGTEATFLSAHPECQSLQSQFKSANTWWVMGYVGAAVLGGTGAYLLWLAPGQLTGPGVVASMNPGITVNCQGRF